MSLELSGISTAKTSDPGSTLRAKWVLDDLLTCDGHRLRAVFSCSLRRLEATAERKFFEETFLARATAVSVEQILAHFKPALTAAAMRMAGGVSAADALAKADRSDWTESLKAAGSTVAFSCGIELLAPFSVELSSPSLEREQLEALQREAIQRSAAQRMEHFHHAGELLKQWETLKASMPTIGPAQLVEQLSPMDRGAMLQTLLMASAQRTKQADLWAVAGEFVARIVFGVEAIRPELFEAPVGAGPLRSVRVIDGHVVVGAQRGVIIFENGNLEDGAVYLDPALKSEHGFAHVTVGAEFITGAHREGGIVRWKRQQRSEPVAVIRAKELGRGPKYLIEAGEGDLVFAVGERVLRFNPGGEVSDVLSFGGPVVGLLRTGTEIVVVTEDGEVARLDQKRLEKISSAQVGGSINGAALLPWLGTARLLLNRADGSIQCIGWDDQLVTQYTSAYLGLRAVAGSVGKIAAMTGDRQRIVYWDSWETRTLAGEIHLGSVTRHRIGDIAFG